MFEIYNIRKTTWRYSSKMIKLLYGVKGSGKTGRIIELANQTAESCAGESVFLTDSEKCVHRLNYTVRLINVTEYEVSTVLGLSGFIRGIIAGNHDVSDIFIDGIHRMTNTNVSELGELFESLSRYADKYNLNIVCTVSTGVLPEFMSGYLCEKV